MFRSIVKKLQKDRKEEVVQITSEEAFNLLKAAKEANTDKSLKKYFLANLKIAEGMQRAGQTAGLNRLRYIMSNIPKEAELIRRGYDKFVWKRKVDEILDESDRDLKIVELEQYTRVLPEKVIKAIENTNDLFSAYFVMFTDYTGKEERKWAQERKNADPILWGAFVEEDPKTHEIYFGERMYPIADWKDEYCDLTLDELCAEYKEIADGDLVETLTIPEMKEQITKRLAEYSINEESEGDVTEE